MNAAERAVFDQEQAFIREEAARQDLAKMLEDQRFCAGVAFAFTMMIHKADATYPFDVSLALLDLAGAWQDLTRQRWRFDG